MGAWGEEKVGVQYPWALRPLGSLYRQKQTVSSLGKLNRASVFGLRQHLRTTEDRNLSML